MASTPESSQANSGKYCATIRQVRHKGEMQAMYSSGDCKMQILSGVASLGAELSAACQRLSLRET